MQQSQSTQKPIGKLLEELGYVTQKQLDVALASQKAMPKFLGEILQQLDFVTSDEIARALALQNRLEYVDLDTITPETEVLRVVPKDFALKNAILPLSIVENTLVVATTEPNDLMVQDFLRAYTRKNIKFVMSDKNKIASYIQLYYYQLEHPIEGEITQMIKDASAKRSIDVVRFIELIFQNAIKERATDIHITPEVEISHIFYRIDGVLKHYYAYPSTLHPNVVSRIKILGSLNIAEQRIPQDGALVFEFLEESYDVRVSTIPTKHGENIVLRILSKSSSLFSLANLGFEENYVKKLEQIFNKPYGIVLVVGPTGSGKTTTLYSALRKIDSLEKNVLTVEDPIEYRFAFIKQTQINEKAGYTFGRAIRAFMRQDPDVMLIGEIRDNETAELAIRASITGHLVLSTLHTNDAPSTIARLEDLGIKSYMIASGLLAIIAQRLVRKLCNHCKREMVVHKSILKEYGYGDDVIGKIEGDTIRIFQKSGCVHCRNTGYIGRSAIIELLEIDDDIKEMIANDKNTYEIAKAARAKAVRTLAEDGLAKVLAGVTTLEEIKRVVG